MFCYGYLEPPPPVFSRADRPPLAEQQQQPANASVSSSAPAERAKAGAKFSLGADCPHESHFTLSLSQLLCVLQTPLSFFCVCSFWPRSRRWLSLLPAHTQISRVAVTQTGISKRAPPSSCGSFQSQKSTRLPRGASK